ncbi:MAG: class I SAM-dependent methyltransferase [Candidatus Marinimicrobia bacterium]|jgi:predicted O-methyltransferase YrrM|nr:class I SAM-dependent methyltransferase [Candidatus Neomarinimicrobiota bacterium]
MKKLTSKEKTVYGIGVIAIMLTFVIFNSPIVSLFSTFVILILLEQRYILEKLLRKNDHHYKQVESLISLYSFLEFKQPLPSMRGMSASPDFLKLIIEKIIDAKPKTIVELGSGTSTLIAAKTLEKYSCGRIYSVENDARFCEQSRSVISEESLSNIATVLHAELKSNTINGVNYLWYNPEFITEIEEKIDLLIVDGPPRILNKNARYPALPCLRSRFTHETIIIMDDANRKDDAYTADLWIKELSNYQCEYIPTEKGTFILSPIEENAA